MKVHAIGSRSDFEDALALIDAMSKWDAEQSSRFGVPEVELLEYVYGHTVETLMEKFREPGAGFFLARADGNVAGCAAYSKSDDSIAELQKMYVRTEARGKGAARGLMTASLAGMRDDGYDRVRLETVSFMCEAITLYESFGFKRCDQFRAIPASLQPITIFMERKL